ncbi:hypothetical protein C0989_009406 [Termitomyces sp. Mn162]|nr:hypothetical protein C0989_009406 [Termitomyces sp. Mn162]
MADIMDLLSQREHCLLPLCSGTIRAIMCFRYFLSQNEAIDAGTILGSKLNLKVLGIGNGLTITNCYNDGLNAVCSEAQSFCNKNILDPLAGNWDVYYVPTANPDPYPPDFSSYLASVETQIGAEVSWQQSNMDVYNNFASTGDLMRNSRPNLETVINAGVRVIIYDGDADFIVNFNGVEAMVDALQTKFTSLYKQQQFTNYTVNGQVAGIYKNAGTFSYMRVFGSGHEVPAYKFGNLAVGQAAAQMFTQIMRNQSLTPT